MNELEIAGYNILFSYNDPVAYRDDKGGCYVTNAQLSVTSRRHINLWLDGRSGSEIQHEDFSKLLLDIEQYGIAGEYRRKKV